MRVSLQGSTFRVLMSSDCQWFVWREQKRKGCGDPCGTPQTTSGQGAHYFTRTHTHSGQAAHTRRTRSHTLRNTHTEAHTNTLEHTHTDTNTREYNHCSSPTQLCATVRKRRSSRRRQPKSSPKPDSMRTKDVGSATVVPPPPPASNMIFSPYTPAP